MLNEALAKALGFTIDYHAPGRPIAYKGARFKPDELYPMLTSKEEALLEQLDRVSSALETMLIWFDDKLTESDRITRHQHLTEAQHLMSNLEWLPESLLAQVAALHPDD